MSRINFLFVKLMLLTWILSCSRANNPETIRVLTSNDGSFLMKSFYPDGKLKQIATFSPDSLLDGSLVSYYPSGSIKVVKNFQHGKKEGISKGSFQNGDLEYVGKYKNDKRDSTWLWYKQYKDEHILVGVENYLDGKKFGGQLDFDSIGHLTKYSFFSLDGLFGMITFDSLEPKTSGSLSFLSYNRDVLDRGEEFYSALYAGVPPGWYADLESTLVDVKNSLEISKNCGLLKTTKWNSEIFTFTCKINNPGNYSFHNVLKIVDEKNKLEYTDTLDLQVKVR
ncbi:MAG: hypothetical protein WA004_20155 [Saprospiraceae bacterium]